MPAKRELTMRQLRYMLRLYHDGVSARAIGRALIFVREGLCKIKSRPAVTERQGQILEGPFRGTFILRPAQGALNTIFLLSRLALSSPGLHDCGVGGRRWESNGGAAGLCGLGAHPSVLRCSVDAYWALSQRRAGKRQKRRQCGYSSSTMKSDLACGW
jgi:hypothetical protein